MEDWEIEHARYLAKEYGIGFVETVYGKEVAQAVLENPGIQRISTSSSSSSTADISKMEAWEIEHVKHLAKEYGMGFVEAAYGKEFVQAVFGESGTRQTPASVSPAGPDLNVVAGGSGKPDKFMLTSAITGKVPGTYTPVQFTPLQTTQEIRLKGEEVAYATGKPIPETFQPLLVPKQLSEAEKSRADEMKDYEEKLKEIPAYRIGSQLSDWAREQFEKMWSSPQDFLIGLAAWFPYVAGESLKGAAAADALITAVGYREAEKAGVRVENVPEYAKDVEKAEFLTRYYNLNVITEVGLGYATGKALGLAAKGVSRIIPQAAKEEISGVFSAAKERIAGRTEGFVYRETYSPSPETPAHFTLMTVEGKGVREIAAEAGPFKLEATPEPLKTPLGEIQPKTGSLPESGMLTSGLAKPSEEIAYPARIQTSFVIGKAKPGEELKSVSERVYPFERGFAEFHEATGKFGDLKIGWTTYEAGARPSLATGFTGKTVSGKEVSAFIKEFPLGESVAYWARLQGRRFFTKFDIYAAPIKEGEKESLVIFEKSRPIFPWAKERYTFVKIQSETARYVSIEKGVYRTAFEPEKLEKMLFSVYPKQAMPETERRVPSAVRSAVFDRLQAELIEKPKVRGVPARALEEALTKTESKPLQRAFGMKIAQQTLIEQATKIKPRISLIPVPKVVSSMRELEKTEMSLVPGVIPTRATFSTEKEAAKVKAPEMIKTGPKQTPFTVPLQEIKPKMETPTIPVPFQTPIPKPPVPLVPPGPAGAFMPKFRVPPFIPLGGDKKQGGMWLKEFAIDERKLAKRLMRGMI
jgi:hypothetical protein